MRKQRTKRAHENEREEHKKEVVAAVAAVFCSYSNNTRGPGTPAPQSLHSLFFLIQLLIKLGDFTLSCVALNPIRCQVSWGVRQLSGHQPTVL